VDLQVKPGGQDRGDDGGEDYDLYPARRRTRAQQPAQCKGGDLHRMGARKAPVPGHGNQRRKQVGPRSRRDQLGQMPERGGADQGQRDKGCVPVTAPAPPDQQRQRQQHRQRTEPGDDDEQAV
jgi:hypothetical protein